MDFENLLKSCDPDEEIKTICCCSLSTIVSQIILLMLVLHTNTCHQLLSSFYEIVQQLKVWWLVMQNYPSQWLQNIFYSYVNLRNILKI